MPKWRWNTPPISPKLTGSLDLRAIWGIRPAIHRLLDLPGGLRFARVMVMCRTKDAELTTDLVSRCSDTLESLEVSYYAPGAFPLASTAGRYLTTTSKSGRDASARPLQGHKTQRALFRCGRSNVQRITEALPTVQSKHLRQFVIHPCPAPVKLIEVTVC